jgi:AcrR family transcriptional regulator
MSARLGRPRSSAADAAIHDAALGLLADEGYDGLTIEAVAERAGVAKSTIYRRYRDKAELLLAAVECSTAATTITPDTGSVAEDLFELARNLRRVLTTTDVGRTLPATLAATARNPALAEAHRQFIARRRRTAFAAVERGIERGEIDTSTDPELLVDMIVGPLFYRTFVTRTPVTDAALRRLVAAAIATTNDQPNDRSRRGR